MLARRGLSVKLRRSLGGRSFWAGAAAIACYVVGTGIAIVLYLGQFGPTEHWLSDLGSAALNPLGALVYNLGVALTGLALIGFFWGLAQWAVGAPRRIRRRLVAVRAMGVIAGLMTIATALVPENVDADLHGWISMWNIELLGTAALLSAVFLYRHPAYWRPIAGWALLTEGVAVLFAFAVHTYVMEWVSIGLVLGYVALMALNMRALGEAEPRVPGAARIPPDVQPSPSSRNS
jgi:hypothetical membrane protein